MLLNNLPLEILELIVLHVSVRDLCHVIATSHRLCDLLQPRLFTNVKLSDIYGCKEGPALSYRVSKFLYAVVRNPRLAHHVRTLEVSGWNVNGFDIEYREEEKKARFDRGLAEKLVEEPHGYTEGERAQWLEDLEEFQTEAWVALLLPKLEKIWKLSLDWPQDSTHILNMFRKAGDRSEPVFLISRKEDGGSIPAYFLNPFFKFPSMRKLGCSRLRDQKREEWGPELGNDEPPLEKDVLQPYCSNITAIDIAQACCFDGLREWIQACKTLKSFRTSLLLHKSTLEAIWIDRSSFGDGNDGWMGSFAEFTALKALAITLPGLVGVAYGGNRHEDPPRKLRKLQDVLPSSLETLYLDLDERFCFSQALDDLSDLVASREFPQLVTIHLNRVIKHENREKVAWLKKVCEKAGVQGFFSHKHRGYRYDVLWMLSNRSLEPIWPFNRAEDLGWYFLEASDTK
ncbi:hypothetical protein N7468_004291 [Penicillium chermesinum]|uniref:F-box domain-containing protein n=1 Tax=Penicillium chermesinum TaxID=63820 RepID=A0A9W9P8B5_9EURO|nr:uncharacterized protein N7468_004291 [Penicillium chermesinum]KAJ5239672.1 hypothetical protein N7468_004291 [Penicillium chermesinum]